MKVSRFEPHILAPLADSNDLDVFMKQVEDEAQHISASSPSTELSDDQESSEEVKRGVLRFIEALGRQTPRKKRSFKKSKKAMALDRYETQKSFDINNFTHYSKIS